MARILVAEDKMVRRFLLTRALSARGHRVTPVRNGAEVLEALENNPFDMVVLDGGLPVLDGAATTRVIRSSRREYAAIPIVGVARSARPGDAEALAEAGLDGFVTRPAPLSVLLSTIHRCLDPGKAHETVTERPRDRHTGMG